MHFHTSRFTFWEEDAHLTHLICIILMCLLSPFCLLCFQIAELWEEDAQIEKAMAAWTQAADCYQAEDSATSANQVRSQFSVLLSFSSFFVFVLFSFYFPGLAFVLILFSFFPRSCLSVSSSSRSCVVLLSFSSRFRFSISSCPRFSLLLFSFSLFSIHDHYSIRTCFSIQ
jgi:hypothetical protein